MKPVVIESPYAGDRKPETIARNLKYLRAAMHDCVVNHNETPYASHGLLTQDGVLDDALPEQRSLGIRAGFVWRQFANATIVYEDLGYSAGMVAGIAAAKELQLSNPKHEIIYRRIVGWAKHPK